VDPGKYIIFLKWRALFDLGDSVQPHDWDAALYYNQSSRPHIDTDDLPPITVKNKDHTLVLLKIQLENYNFISIPHQSHVIYFKYLPKL